MLRRWRFALALLATLPPRAAWASRPEATLPETAHAEAAATCARPGAPGQPGAFVFVVDRHALVETVGVSAEGLAGGRRTTLSLTAQPCATQPQGDVGHPHGRVLLRVSRAWPDAGAWTVRVTLRYRLDDGTLAGSEVLMDPATGRVTGPRHFVDPPAPPREWYADARFGEEEIRMALQGR